MNALLLLTIWIQFTIQNHQVNMTICSFGLAEAYSSNWVIINLTKCFFHVSQPPERQTQTRLWWIHRRVGQSLAGCWLLASESVSAGNLLPVQALGNMPALYHFLIVMQDRHYHLSCWKGLLLYCCSNQRCFDPTLTSELHPAVTKMTGGEQESSVWHL